jgi:hypothetical protein
VGDKLGRMEEEGANDNEGLSLGLELGMVVGAVGMGVMVGTPVSVSVMAVGARDTVNSNLGLEEASSNSVFTFAFAFAFVKTVGTDVGGSSAETRDP